MTPVNAGPTMRKMIVYFHELNTTGPVLVETGTNTSWPDGAEVKMIENAIQRDDAYYASTPMFVYWVHEEANPREVKDLRWEEFVADGTSMLTMSTADLLPAQTPESPQQDLASGVTIPPMLIFSVQIQETMECEKVAMPNPVYSESETTTVQVPRLRKRILSHLALPSSSQAAGRT